MDEHVIADIPQRPIIAALDGCPTIAETEKAIEQLQSGKAPGPYGIPPEAYKLGGHPLTKHLVDLFQLYWENGKPPQNFKDPNIIHLNKNKGEKSVWDNHRGISFLRIAGKILAHVLLNRIIAHLLDSVIFRKSVRI